MNNQVQTTIRNAGFKDAQDMWHIVPVQLVLDVNNSFRPIWPVTIMWGDTTYKFKRETASGRVLFEILKEGAELPIPDDLENYEGYLEEKLAHVEHIAHKQGEIINNLNTEIKDLKRDKMENENKTFNLNEVLPDKKDKPKRPDDIEGIDELSPDDYED